MGQSTPKRSKEQIEATRTAIIDAKAMDYMEMIQDHLDFITTTNEPPIEALDFSGILPSPKTLSTKFVD